MRLKDWFSIEWLPNLFTKMTNSKHLLKHKQNVPDFFPFRMVGFGAQKIMMSSTKNGKAFSNQLFLHLLTIEWQPQPYFCHRMVAYTGVNPSYSMEAMARVIKHTTIRTTQIIWLGQWMTKSDRVQARPSHSPIRAKPWRHSAPPIASGLRARILPGRGCQRKDPPCQCGGCLIYRPLPLLPHPLHPRETLPSDIPWSPCARKSSCQRNPTVFSNGLVACARSGRQWPSEVRSWKLKTITHIHSAQRNTDQNAHGPRSRNGPLSNVQQLNSRNQLKQIKLPFLHVIVTVTMKSMHLSLSLILVQEWTNSMLPGFQLLLSDSDDSRFPKSRTKCTLQYRWLMANTRDTCHLSPVTW